VRLRAGRIEVKLLAPILCLGFFAGPSGVDAAPQDAKLEGVVRDASGAAIQGAEVIVTQQGGHGVAITDGEGKFAVSIPPAEPSRITVRAPGFAPAELTWKPGDSLQIEIVLRPATLTERVTVTATRISERVSDTASSISVISREELSANASLTLDAKLRQVPGFMLFRRTDSRTANPTTQGVSLRAVGASGASRALVLADGVPLNDPFGGWIYWDRIPKSSVQSVEVMRGGASDLYGTGALGGVIHIIPSRPQHSAFSMETAFGSAGTVDSSLAGTLRRGDWIATAAGGLFRTDGYFPVSESDRGQVDRRANSGHATANVRLERIVSERLRLFGEGSILEESRENGSDLQTNRTRLRGLVAGGNWSSDSLGVLTLRAYGGPQTYDQSFSAISADRKTETLTRLQRVPAQQTGVSGEWSRVFGARQTIVAGFEGREVRGASDELGFFAASPTTATGAGGRQRSTGFFLESITRPSERWMIQASLRTDYWRNQRGYLNDVPIGGAGAAQSSLFPDRAEHAISPRFSVLRKVNEQVALSASVYRAFRAPTLNELYRSFRVGNVVTQANPDLRAERLTGGEAGASVAAFKQRLKTRGSVFWGHLASPVSNVTLDVQPNLITRQRQNLGSTRARGVEIELEGQVSNSLTIAGAYQFADARVHSFPADVSLEGLLIPHVPRHVLTFQARYVGPRGFIAALQGRVVGKEFDDDQNALPLNRYCLMEATVARPLGRGVELFAAAENLLDAEYDVARTPVRTVGPPVTVRAGIRFTTR